MTSSGAHVYQHGKGFNAKPPATYHALDHAPHQCRVSVHKSMKMAIDRLTLLTLIFDERLNHPRCTWCQSIYKGPGVENSRAVLNMGHTQRRRTTQLC